MHSTIDVVFLFLLLNPINFVTPTAANGVQLGGYTLVKAPEVQKLFPSYFFFAPLNVTTKFLTGHRTSHLTTTTSALTTKVTDYDFQFVVREAGQSQSFLFLTARVKLEIAEKYCRFTQEYKSDLNSEEYFLEGRLNLRGSDGKPLTWMIFVYLSLPFDEVENPAKLGFYDFNVFGVSARRFRWEQLKLKSDAADKNSTRVKLNQLAEEMKTTFVQKHTDLLQSQLEKQLNPQELRVAVREFLLEPKLEEQPTSQAQLELQRD